MGACVSQPSARNSGKLFPGVRATQSAEPSVIVLRPPGAGAPRAPPRSPPRRAAPPRARPIATSVLDVKPTSTGAAELANAHSMAAAAAAAEAKAATAAMSLQLALVDLQKPPSSGAPSPSTVVATETVEAVGRLRGAPVPQPYAPYVDEEGPVPVVF